MGTNYYLRRVKPRLVFDEYHVLKISGGWRPHFQDSTAYRYDPEAPAYRSVADIRALIRSGEYDLVDEYGEGWMGEGAIEKLEELCAWPGTREPPLGGAYGGYRDPEGYVFEAVEFS